MGIDCYAVSLPTAAHQISPPARVLEYREPLQAALIWRAIMGHAPGRLGEMKLAEDKLAAIGDMKDNWDGYGALAALPKTSRNAERFLTALLRSVPPPDVTPNSNGTVSFEWETASGIAELEVGQSRFSFYLKPKGSPPVLIDGPAAQVPSHISPWILALLYPRLLPPSTVTNVQIA